MTTTHKTATKTKATKAKEVSMITDRVPRVENSTDATRGQPLAERVQARLVELEAILEATDLDELTLREELELSIAAAEPMLTGDLDNVPAVVAADMNLWLERNKHLAEVTPVARAARKSTKRAAH